MNDELIVDIAPDGTITTIYDDALIPLFEEGNTKTRRASHVEPADNGTWTVDLTPVSGPVMTGFRLRGDALNAEVGWIKKNLLGKGQPCATLSENCSGTSLGSSFTTK